MKIWKHRSGVFELTGKPLIMGILNVTPDSFSDGGLYLNSQTAIEHCKQMICDGADIIDVGAMSTRPGSLPISACEEIARLEKVLPSICGGDAVISVDTVNPETAQFALECGADIINDVSGEYNPLIAEKVEKYSAGWVMTHTKPKSAETDLLSDIEMFFSDFLQKCENAGLDRECICLDPGFGFSKDDGQNEYLLRNIGKIEVGKTALLVALSRKRFIGKLTNTDDAEKRDDGTLAADFYALSQGADIVRVHNVAATKKMIDIYNSIYNYN